jgi:peptidoglycan/LPS O-acetylase OafA/YrhL
VGRLGYRPALDGVRAIAISAVIVSHAGLIAGGYLGVDIFFVLSGFLITTLLLEEWDSSGVIGLRAFYRRRAARLLPALVLLVAVLTTIVVIVVASGRLEQRALPRLLEECVYALFYVTNFAKIFVPHMKLAYLWSLAEEEQFYILWPPLLLLVLRRHLSPHRLSLVLCVAVILLAANRIAVYGFGGSWEWLISSPQTRSDPIAVGCLAAVATKTGMLCRFARRAGTVSLVAVATLIAPIAMVGSSQLGFVFGLLPFALAAAVLVVSVTLAPNTPVARALSVRPLVFLGQISYSLYLWHALFIVGEHGAGLFLSVVAAVFVSWLSYRYVERPCRRLLSGRRVHAIPAVA